MTEKVKDGEQLAIMLLEFLSTQYHLPIPRILASLNIVLASIADQAGYSENECVKAFRECFQQAHLRNEKLKKELN